VNARISVVTTDESFCDRLWQSTCPAPSHSPGPFTIGTSPLPLMDCNLDLTVSRGELVTNGDCFAGKVEQPEKQRVL
jgi:hypothetical protein